MTKQRPAPLSELLARHRVGIRDGLLIDMSAGVFVDSEVMAAYIAVAEAAGGVLWGIDYHEHEALSDALATLTEVLQRKLGAP